jgi:hypothetical protein
MGPVITSIVDERGRAGILFIGLVEAAVVQAFRQTDLPLQRIRTALSVLEQQGELQHALASRKLMTDGANVLYDYAGTPTTDSSACSPSSGPDNASIRT